MIHVESTHSLQQMETALCRAAQRNGACVIAITPFAPLFSEAAPSALEGATSFTVCHTAIYSALIAADIRFAAFLPCRIAAVSWGEGVSLETISPGHYCALLDRPDLDGVVESLDVLLRAIMEDAARTSLAPVRPHPVVSSKLGAREGQGSMTAPIPQRIDCHGTKIEDLAGTGKVDAPGG